MTPLLMFCPLSPFASMFMVRYYAVGESPELWGHWTSNGYLNTEKVCP
jgi:hypothetical protein